MSPAGERRRRDATTDARAHDPRRRSAARLAAVQALYEIDIVSAPVDAVLADYLGERWSLVAGDEDRSRDRGTGVPRPDRAMFDDLVGGVSENRPALDVLVSACLRDGWSIDRLEVLLRAILRAGAYELDRRPDIPARVVVVEYVNVAHAFFDGKEPGLVNGVLDHLARELRADEFRVGIDDSGSVDG